MEFSSHRKARLRKQARSVTNGASFEEAGEEMLLPPPAAPGGCNGGKLLTGIGVTSFSSPSRRPLLEPGASIESASSLSEHSASPFHHNCINNLNPPRSLATDMPTSIKWPPVTEEADSRVKLLEEEAKDKSEKKVSIVEKQFQDESRNEFGKRSRRKKGKKRENEEEDVFDAPGVYDPNSENLLGFVDLLQIEKGKGFQVSEKRREKGRGKKGIRLSLTGW